MVRQRIRMERKTRLQNKTPMDRGRAPLRRVALRANPRTTLERRSITRRRRPNPEAKEYAQVHRRSGGRCEVRFEDTGRCRRPRMRGCHHLTKRAQGGAGLGDLTMIMDLCAAHHDMADNASLTQRTTTLDGEVRVGRLVIEPGTFRGRMVTSGTRSLVGVPA